MTFYILHADDDTGIDLVERLGQSYQDQGALSPSDLADTFPENNYFEFPDVDTVEHLAEVRTAVAAALDHPFAEAGFALVDDIVARVTEDRIDAGAETHEIAAEIADTIVSTLSTFGQATLWAVLSANDAGSDFYGVASTTAERITADLFAIVEAATFAAIEIHQEA